MTTVLYTASQTVLNNGPLNNAAYYSNNSCLCQDSCGVGPISMTQRYCHVTPSCAAAKYSLG
ncbi:hypothetical protein BCR33DRAFT_713306, partial [Rhizoclosmatium globosum]